MPELFHSDLTAGWKMSTGTKRIALLLFASCFFAIASFATDIVSGKVRNQTTQRPSSGDDVVLLRMGEGMQEEARTRTDGNGAFSLQVEQPNAQYVVRVLHGNVNYDHALTGTSPFQVDVFDTASSIQGLHGTLGMAQLESDGQILKITEMYSINNGSSPPMTQAGPRNFEMSLPAGATLDSFSAKRAQGIWVNLAAAPVQGQKSRYAVDFPLRPGDTLFKYAYHLSASGATTLHLKPAYPVQSFAVMHPVSMKFKPVQPRSFTSPGAVKGLQVEQAKGTVIREVPAFEISGIGAAPVQAQSEKPALPAGVHSGAPETIATKNSAVQNEAGQRRAQTWAIAGLMVVLVGAGAFAAWRRRQSAPDKARPSRTASSLEALKEEMFQLESERSQGAISAEQYASAKSALSLSLQRALSREKVSS